MGKNGTFLIQKKDMFYRSRPLLLLWVCLLFCADPARPQTTSSRLRALDPSQGVGTVQCVDHGAFQRCCDRVDDVAPLCVEANRQDKWRCVWIPLPRFSVNVTVSPSNPELVHVSCTPEFDVPPLIEFLFDFAVMLACFVFACKVSGLADGNDI